MTQNGSLILREAREAAHLTRQQLANRMECISEGTLKRWEFGESRPDSADVARMGEIIGDRTLWPRWMCATDDEYAKRHPFSFSDIPAAMAVTKVGFEIADVQGLVDKVVRDLMDGKIDDQNTAHRFLLELDEAERAIAEAKIHLKEV